MISEYNNKICERLVDYIKYFTERIEASTENPCTIEFQKYVVIDSNNFDINYLMVHGLTGMFTVKCYFKITQDGVVKEVTEDIEIPKMINNVFVIEGTLRVPTNTLDNDDAVTIYDANIRINEFINISYLEDEHEPDGYALTIQIYEDEEPTVIQGTRENFETYKEQLKLTHDENCKLQIKLDTDQIGDYLTYDLVMRLINLGPDRMRDNIVDKKIYSPESNLMKYLWSRDVRKKILTNMRSKFYQYSHVFLRDIQNAINRYFYVASEKNIDFPSTVNPLIFDAMKYKIVIPKNVAYNNTMTDIIDVANTPINQNCNRINELNVCVEIEDDRIFIKCYTYPDQTPVKVPYLDYCTKKVLICDHWDYNSKQFKSDSQLIKYRLRQKIRQGTTSDQFDYIEPMADDKLSITTRRIPFGNMSDSVRIAMGATMEKQAVELANSEPPLITTGHDDTDFELSTLITKFRGKSGIVEKIKDNKIFVKDPKTGSIQFFEIPSPTPGANDSIISFESSVKVGDSLTEGSELIIPHMLKRKSFELGNNIEVVYLNYLGMTHEDGVVISESCANKLTHYSIIDVYKEIYPDDIIKFMKRIGSKVTSKDILVNNQTRLRVSSALRDTYATGGLLGGMGISYNQSNLIVPNNIDEGYVLNATIKILDGRELTSDTSKETIDNFLKQSPVEDYNFLPEHYRNLKANEINDISDKASGYISYKILRVDRAKIGDKTTNRYGSKGIISLVLPDECMPQIVRGDQRIPSQMILNPAAVLSRRNLSQLHECSMVKCINEIYKRVNAMLSDGNMAEARQFLDKFKVVYDDKFSKLSDQEFIEQHRTQGIGLYQMRVGFFSRISYDQMLEWMKFLNVNESEQVFLPDVVIVETKQGLKGFLKDKYVPQPDHRNKKVYELGYCEQPVVTGNEYIMKLWKQASYDGKVTNEVMDTEEPVMGRGKYRFTGQSIGEMESWILLETGSEEFLTKQSETMKTSQYQFLNELLLSGYYIQDPYGNPLLTNQRSKAAALDALDKS